MERKSIICEKSLKQRLSKDLVISPILDPKSQIRDCSIDLRLGMQIVFPRLSEHEAINPENIDESNIVKYQRIRKLFFGEKFTIHPRKLILASTFEFICLPNDISGFVLSRSSYGRLGLIVATATFVHANWKGCLTLELVNEGELPITLTSGSCVAQLVLHYCDVIPSKKINDIPLSPQYRRTLNKKEIENIASLE